MSERRDFPQWVVDAVYKIQEGCCIKCGNSLKRGFHRHHKDGDNSNNNTDNLELHCAECHRATFGDAVTEHKKQEQKVLDNLNQLLDKGLEGKVSGKVMEEMQELMMTSLKVSRSIQELDKGIEYPSASIAFGAKMKEMQILSEYYLQGLREGISLGVKEKNK